jgi:hypothetical protein
LRGRFDDQSNREGNLGLGVRRMLDGGWNLGGYGYLDRRRSENDQYYSQVTLGAEALGRDWDLRGNVYLPQGDRVRDLGTSGGGASTVAVSGNAIVVTTPGTTTLEERALRGFDVEIGGRVPLFDADDPRQLRLYTGNYRFKDDVLTVRGSRWRAELTLAELPGLWGGAQLIGSAEMQDDNARGGQSYLSLRIRIPLGGRKDGARPSSTQERRMTAPVMRDVDIVTQSRTVVSTPTLVETADALDNGRPFAFISSAATAGSALPAAVAAAGANSTVLLSGAFNTGLGIVQLQAGQTLMGAGTLIVRTPSGRTATLTTPSATIAASGSAAAVSMASNSVLTGMNVSATNGAGSVSGVRIFFGVSGATISGNAIDVSGGGASFAYGISIFGGLNHVIADNTVTVGSATTANALDVMPTTPSSFRLSGNTLSSSQNHTSLQAVVGTIAILPGSTGNTALSGGCLTVGTITGAIGLTSGASCP